MPKPSEDIDNALDKPLPSVRETLTAALKEQREEDDADDGEDDDKEVKAKAVEGEIEDDDPLSEGIDEVKEPANKKAKAAEPVDEETEEIDDKSEEVEEETLEEEEAPKLKQPKIAAPDNWKDTKDWEKTPASVRQKIVAREQEVSNGFKEYGVKARAFDEYEQIIGPRRQSMAKIGVTPVQVIGRALDWMDALGHPDPRTKSQAFKVLANNFGIDVASLASANSNSRENSGGGGDELPETVKQYVGSLQSEIAQLKQQIGGVRTHLETQQDRAAAEYLDNWPKDKPHFPKVHGLVATYLQSGNGTIDLDTAYNMAIAANPEVKELIRLEELEKTKADAAKKAKDAAKMKQVRLQKAKGANSSLKPGSPASNLSTKGLKNGASVKDTIKFSLKQMAENA